MRPIFAEGLLVLAACGATEAEQRASYVAIVQDGEPDPGDLDRCALLDDRALAGDCALVVAARAGFREGDAGRYCERVPAGPWRDECWFQAAETHRERRRTEAALEACERAGAFRDRCRFHLWQDEIARGLEGADDLAGAIAAGEPIFAAWDERLGPRWTADHGALPMGVPLDDTSFGAVFWSRLFVQWFERSPAAPDPAVCAAAGERARLCEAAAADVQWRRSRDQR